MLKAYLTKNGVPVDPLGWLNPGHAPWRTPLEEVALPGALAAMQQGIGWKPNAPLPERLLTRAAK
jgi:hypothetical protein